MSYCYCNYNTIVHRVVDGNDSDVINNGATTNKIPGLKHEYLFVLLFINFNRAHSANTAVTTFKNRGAHGKTRLNEYYRFQSPTLLFPAMRVPRIGPLN